MWIAIGIGGGVILLLIILALVSYNRFVKLNTKADEAFSTMDIYLVKRWELIPKLVDSVKGYMSHEKNTLKEIADLRNRSYDGLSDSDKIRTNTALSKSLGQVVAVAEDYPDLKSSENFLQLSEMLFQVEDEIAQSRKYYNGSVKAYNNKCQTFPSSFIASTFRFEPRTMFEVSREEERENVKVEF